jgi:hypothetical protein
MKRRVCDNNIDNKKIVGSIKGKRQVIEGQLRNHIVACDRVTIDGVRIGNWIC